MKIPAKIECPWCKSVDGFDLEIVDVESPDITVKCYKCHKTAFKMHIFSILEVNEKGEVIIAKNSN